METINLLNGKEFCPNFSIMERLEEGLKSHSLIYTNNMRGIGKTYNLIKFAKEHNRIVAVAYGAERLRKECDYKEIYNKNDYTLNDCMGIVIDEQVEFSKIISEESVFTGFTTIKPKTEDQEEEYPGQVIESLRKDALDLSERLTNNTNNSDYKMLITNLRTTVEAIQYLEQSYKLK